MIHPTPILLIPMYVMIWALDFYLSLACVRLGLSWCHAEWAKRTCTGLKPLTDPIPNAIERHLSTRRSKAVPAWLPWLVAMGGILVARHLIVSLVSKTI